MSVNKTKKGKVLSVCLEDQKLEFMKYRDHLSNKNLLPPPSSKIFLDIRQQLSYRMSIKALYISLKKNFNYFFSTDESNITDYGRSLPISEDNTNSSYDSENSKSAMTIRFNIPAEDWLKIKPVTSYCSRADKYRHSDARRKKTNLPKNKWTNIMSKILFIETQRECTWVFKYSSATSDNNFRFSGYCKQCGAKISASSIETSETHAEMQCRIEDGDLKIIHDPKIKNKLSTHQKREIAKKLKKQQPVVLRNKMVNGAMGDNGGYEPPFVPSLKSLQNIKQRSNEYFHKDVIIALWIMATSTYKTLIRMISLMPFILYFWSDLQDRYYQYLEDSKRKIKLSIDATGSLFKKLMPPRDTDSYIPKHIFLYVAVVQTDKSCIPITQMVTDLHTLENIYKWLNNWRGNKQVPNEIVCDDSAALVGAIVKTFTHFQTTKEYIAYCFNLLLNNEAIKESHCLIRLDTSHFIKTLYNSGCFRYTDERVKMFYVKYLRKIKMSNTFTEAQFIVENLIVVALSKYTGKDQKDNHTPCYRSLSALCQLDFQQETDNNVETVCNEELNTKYYDKDGFLFNSNCEEEIDILKYFTKKVDAIQVEVQLTENANLCDNLYFLPDFINILKRLFSKLPLWSNVMLSLVETDNTTPTSSDVESYFKNVKTLLKSPSERLRIDEFLIRFNEYMSGEIKKSMSDSNFLDKKTKSENNGKNIIKIENADDNFSEESVLCEDPIPIENWRGLNIAPAGNTKRLKKLQNNKCAIIHVLSNGNNCPTGVSGLIVENTCAFDSVVQSLAVAYADRMSIRKLFDTKESGFMTLIKNLANRDFSQNVYQIRANIINKYYYEKTITRNFTTIDCMTNVTFPLDKILVKDISIVKSKKICTNQSCKQNCPSDYRIISYMPLNVLILSDKGVQGLKESAESMLRLNLNIPCKKTNNYMKCNGNQMLWYEIQEILLFEIDLQTELKQIPVSIQLQGNEYSLFSVVEYDPQIRHYVAHCRRINNEWQSYDDLTAKVRAQTDLKRKITIHCIMYSIL